MCVCVCVCVCEVERLIYIYTHTHTHTHIYYFSLSTLCVRACVRVCLFTLVHIHLQRKCCIMRSCNTISISTLFYILWLWNSNIMCFVCTLNRKMKPAFVHDPGPPTSSPLAQPYFNIHMGSYTLIPHPHFNRDWPQPHLHCILLHCDTLCFPSPSVALRSKK